MHVRCLEHNSLPFQKEQIASPDNISVDLRRDREMGHDATYSWGTGRGKQVRRFGWVCSSSVGNTRAQGSEGPKSS